MARMIDGEAAYRFLSEQLVKETGAFSKGVNKGLNIARSAMRNPDAIPALRPITREQVEKTRGEWIDRRALSDAPVECSNCGEWVYGKLQDANFCPFCGVPMTDKAVDMVMERLEAEYE